MSIVGHNFPLRGGEFLAQVVAPHDITREEAEHLCSFIHSLVTSKARTSRRPAAPGGVAPKGLYFITGREKGVALWRVRFDVEAHVHGSKIKSHKRCFLVAAADQYQAAIEGHRLAYEWKGKGWIRTVQWTSTEAVVVPMDLTEFETSHTTRAFKKGLAIGQGVVFEDGAWRYVNASGGRVGAFATEAEAMHARNAERAAVAARRAKRHGRDAGGLEDMQSDSLDPPQLTPIAQAIGPMQHTVEARHDD